MDKIKLNTFAEACYNNNSIEELEFMLASGPDRGDCKAWKISPKEWEDQIYSALRALEEEKFFNDFQS